MDEIEAGFQKIVEKIGELGAKERALADNIRQNDAALLERMANSAIPVVKSIGLFMLYRGKQDIKGEIYDPGYHPRKMIILGKTEPAPFRPDDVTKKVVDQFCVLDEDGKFFELMYSSDGFLTDSYLNPVDPKTALEIYGYDVMFMLYQAMHDCLKGEEALVEALEKTISYIFPQKTKDSPP
jgi:hypothetical protein